MRLAAAPSALASGHWLSYEIATPRRLTLPLRTKLLTHLPKIRPNPSHALLRLVRVALLRVVLTDLALNGIVFALGAFSCRARDLAVPRCLISVRDPMPSFVANLRRFFVGAAALYGVFLAVFH